MAVGSTLNRITQLGLETVKGTPVAATKRLKAVSIELGAEEEYQTIRPRGDKYTSAHVQTQESSSGDISGGFAFDEFHILAAGAFSKPAAPTGQLPPAWQAATGYVIGDVVRPTSANGHVYRVTAVSGTAPYTSHATTEPVWPTSSGGTIVDNELTWTEVGADTPGGYLYTFNTDNFGADDMQTFTVEEGDKVRDRSNRMSYGIIPELGVSSARSGEVEISGSMIGRNLEPFTLSTGVTETAPYLATPPMLNVYLDSLPGGLGTTKLRNFSIEKTLSDRFGPVWLHDRDLASYAEHVETEPSMECSLTIVEDAIVDTIMDSAKDGIRQYLRMEFLGKEAAPGVRYGFRWDSALQISDARDYSDEDGVYAVELSLEAEYDDTLGYATRASLINKKATLGA